MIQSPDLALRRNAFCVTDFNHLIELFETLLALHWLPSFLRLVSRWTSLSVRHGVNGELIALIERASQCFFSRTSIMESKSHPSALKIHGTD
jgi:hypothetical protein